MWGSAPEGPAICLEGPVVLLADSVACSILKSTSSPEALASFALYADTPPGEWNIVSYAIRKERVEKTGP